MIGNFDFEEILEEKKKKDGWMETDWKKLSNDG